VVRDVKKGTFSSHFQGEFYKADINVFNDVFGFQPSLDYIASCRLRV